MRELMVLIAFAAAASTANAQTLYDQGTRGSASGQGAGQSYVMPYNEPSRITTPSYGSPYAAPQASPRMYDLMAPAPQPSYRAPPPVVDYDDRAYNRRTR